MALTVTQAFDEFQKNVINIDSEKAAKAVSSRDWLIGQINNFPANYIDFPAIYSEKNIAYGSFSRKTKKRPLDDVDLMICLIANGCTYLEYSDKIEITVPESELVFSKLTHDGTKILNSTKVINKFISKLVNIPQYNKAEIKKNLEAVTLNLSSYDWVFDILPCFFTTEDSLNRTYYIIPDGKGNWKKTDPRIDKTRISNLNANHDGNILNVIRAIKYWNTRATMPTISSYLLENIIIEYYLTKTTKASKYLDLVINDPKGLQGNLNTLSNDEKTKISNRAYDDYSKAFAARQLETAKDMKGSITKWSEIFGINFPSYG